VPLLLFDRNCPNPLIRGLTGFTIRTTQVQGWNTLTNGALLRAAERAGFDIMLSADRNLRHQQNLQGRRLALVVMSSPAWPLVQPHIALVQAALDAATAGSYQEVVFPRPALRRKPPPEAT
jgi:hypothetical protein